MWSTAKDPIDSLNILLEQLRAVEQEGDQFMVS